MARLTPALALAWILVAEEKVYIRQPPLTHARCSIEDASRELMVMVFDSLVGICCFVSRVDDAKHRCS